MTRHDPEGRVLQEIARLDRDSARAMSNARIAQSAGQWGRAKHFSAQARSMRERSRALAAKHGYLDDEKVTRR